ncbi:hypothetical protein L6452_15716 [Arctium lappa]|uniref:Uncharacterized protein n=1 Tax=Arctium lappa TaxID=4217 RepID=A0ACB9CPE9_ARCLA|nr:hypothetical protein L6452_15716 [Arctium lappa]
MAPKAAAEKKPTATEKARAKKKPKVEKKLPKDASVAGADKKEEEAQEIGGDLQDLHIQGLFFLVRSRLFGARQRDALREMDRGREPSGELAGERRWRSRVCIRFGEGV